MFYSLGMISCIVPGLITICQLFPLWQKESFSTLASGITVSGMAVLLLLLTSTPLLREFKSKIQTPAAWIMWLIGTVVCYAISRVIEDIALVCFVSFLGNLIGAMLFKVSEHFPKEKVPKEDANEEYDEEYEESEDE